MEIHMIASQVTELQNKVISIRTTPYVESLWEVIRGSTASRQRVKTYQFAISSRNLNQSEAIPLPDVVFPTKGQVLRKYGCCLF